MPPETSMWPTLATTGYRSLRQQANFNGASALRVRKTGTFRIRKAMMPRAKTTCAVGVGVIAVTTVQAGEIRLVLTVFCCGVAARAALLA